MLSGIIINKIKNEGPISFHDFMEMALYYPHLGYYTSANSKIGIKGDFYTASSLGPAFGTIIGKQLEEMWQLLGKEQFTIVEYGAGTGELCHDILDYLKSNSEFYDKLIYCIVEKSPEMRKKEKVHLNEKVCWCDSIKDIPGVTGCIFSNELVDNFSVHQVIMLQELMEVFVDYDKSGFIEILKPASQELKNYFTELKVSLPEGFRTEINTEAMHWIQEIAGCLKKGYVLTFDYGYLSNDLYTERRNCGTIMCYNKHRMNDQPYINVGEQDITSHVNFSALMHWGLEGGLTFNGITDQVYFLLSLGIMDHLQNVYSNENVNSYMKQAALKHTLLVDMGNRFKVLIQSKNAPGNMLSGLKLKPLLPT